MLRTAGRTSVTNMQEDTEGCAGFRICLRDHHCPLEHTAVRSWTCARDRPMSSPFKAKNGSRLADRPCDIGRARAPKEVQAACRRGAAVCSISVHSGWTKRMSACGTEARKSHCLRNNLRCCVRIKIALLRFRLIFGNGEAVDAAPVRNATQVRPFSSHRRG